VGPIPTREAKLTVTTVERVGLRVHIDFLAPRNRRLRELRERDVRLVPLPEKDRAVLRIEFSIPIAV